MAGFRVKHKWNSTLSLTISSYEISGIFECPSMSLSFLNCKMELKILPQTLF